MKELEDHDWFPRILRHYQTDYIGFVIASFGIYKPFILYLKKENMPFDTMFDLCSGSGEPAIYVFRNSIPFSHLILTDKYPRVYESQAHDIKYLNTSFDVLEKRLEPKNTYTMFNAFHHFNNKQKNEIVQRIIHSGSEGFIVEVLEPTLFCFLKVLFACTVGTLLLTPFIKPFSVKRLFFTYIIPVNLFTITYDGLVSVFKSKTVGQYQHTLHGVKVHTKVFKLKNGLSPLIVIHIT